MANNLNSLFTYEDDLFYFESDHLALKGNKDYCEVLKTLVVLSALREKAIKDFNKVVEIRKKALEDPFHILEQIQNDVDLGVPPLVELPKIPVINFKKFDVMVPEEDLKIIYENPRSNKYEEDCKDFKQNNSNNRAWTPEEQKKLEELLIVYPPEPIEMRRFQKIARALGNRTVQQVTSRVQKYFLKLYKAGLPIPGRIPKSSEKYKKSVLHKHQRHNHYLWKPTTFFPDLYVPVVMNDLDNIPGPSINSSSASTSTSGSSNYLIPTEYHHNSDVPLTKTDPEIQLNLLKRVRIEKVREQQENYNFFQHLGYRCDYCDVEPIIGTRWHCTVCTDSVDYCTDCVLSQMYSDNPHPLHHALAVFYSDVENSNLPISDSESCGGSIVTRNYESDSNNGDFESSSNLDNFSHEIKLETSTYDIGSNGVDYKNTIDFTTENNISQNDTILKIENDDVMQEDIKFEYNE